jgi:hypothetical protein
MEAIQTRDIASQTRDASRGSAGCFAALHRLAQDDK